MKNNSVHIPLLVSDKIKLDELSKQMRISRTKIAEVCFSLGLEKLITEGDKTTIPLSFLQTRQTRGGEQ